MPSKYYAIDASTGLIKRALAQAAVTADAYIGTQWDQGAAVVTDGILIVTVEAFATLSNDELYTFRVVGSNVADRSDGVILATLELGHATALPIDTVDTAVGQQYEARFRTEKADVAYRYIDLHLDVAGSSPSITFGAYISREV